MNSDTYIYSNFNDIKLFKENNSSTNQNNMPSGLFTLKNSNQELSDMFEPYEDKKEDINEELIYDKKIDELLSKELINKLISISPLPPQDLSKKLIITENLIQEREESISKKSEEDLSSNYEEEENDNSDNEDFSNNENNQNIKGGEDNKICDYSEFENKIGKINEKDGVNMKNSFFNKNNKIKNKKPDDIKKRMTEKELGNENSFVSDNIYKSEKIIPKDTDKNLNYQINEKERYDFNQNLNNFSDMDNRLDNKDNINNKNIAKIKENNCYKLSISDNEEKEHKIYEKDGKEQINFESKSKMEGIIFNSKNENLLNNQPFFPKNHFNNTIGNQDHLKNANNQEIKLDDGFAVNPIDCKQNSNSEQHFLNKNNNYYYSNNNNFPDVKNNYNKNTVNIYHINNFYNLPEIGQKNNYLNCDKANLNDKRTNFLVNENSNDNKDINNNNYKLDIINKQVLNFEGNDNNINTINNNIQTQSNYYINPVNQDKKERKFDQELNIPFISALGIDYRNINPDNYLIKMFGRLGWICRYCNNFNFETRDKCNRCQSIKNPILKEEMTKNKENKKKLKKKKKERKTDWLCLNCNNLNYGFRYYCNRCSIERKIYFPAIYLEPNQKINGANNNEIIMNNLKLFHSNLNDYINNSNQINNN